MNRAFDVRRRNAWMAVFAGTALVFGLSGTAFAAAYDPDAVPAGSIEMKGSYIWTGVSTAGSLGVGENIVPGLIHDPTGTGTFDVNTDYIAPGSPWEGFSLRVGPGDDLRSNNNDGYTSPQIPGTGSLQDLSGTAGYDHHVKWTGAIDGQYEMSHEFFFNDGDERINVKTTIKALTALGGVQFQRTIDPDQDSWAGGGSDTVNIRGYDGNSDGDFTDSGDIAPEDWVFSSGDVSKRVVSLYTLSDVPHNTAISEDWTEDPSVTLTGVDDGDGDNTISMAFDVGDMTKDQVVELLYAYVMGGSLEDVINGGGSSAIENKPPIQNMINASLRNLAGIVAARAHLPLTATAENSGEWRAWAQQVITNVDHDKDSDFDGYDTDITQTVVGLEKSYGNLAAGLAFSIGEIDEMDMDHSRDESDADMFTATVYGNYTENALFASAGLTYAHNDIDEEYPDRSAEASFEADAYSAHILGGYQFPLADWLTVIPTAGVRATYYDQDGYTESSAAARKVDSYDQWFVESTLGGTLAAKIALVDDVNYEPVMFEPELSVAWLHEFNDDNEKLDFANGTSAGYYRLQGAEADQVQISLALNATIGTNLKIGISAVGEGNDDVESLAYMGNITYQF